MNVACNEKIIKLYMEVYYRSFHEYNSYLFCYTALLKIVEQLFSEFSCNDITKGIHYLVKEQIIFPEINYDHIDKIRGMDICINTSAKNKDEAKALLEALQFPFKK